MIKDNLRCLTNEATTAGFLFVSCEANFNPFIREAIFAPIEFLTSTIFLFLNVGITEKYKIYSQ